LRAIDVETASDDVEDLSQHLYEHLERAISTKFIQCLTIHAERLRGLE